jgi:hypothetical protein
MRPCPNCNQPVGEGMALCPHCGQDMRPFWNAAATQLEMEWKAVGASVEDADARRRRDRWNILFGFLTAAGLSCVIPIFMIGSVLSILLYFIMRKSNPAFAKGLGWGCLVGFFGAIAVCTHGII